MDEKAGRRIATNLGLRVARSARVLLATKRRRLIASVQPLLEALAGYGYHFL
jgi:predicted nucleic acid-binding protein